MITCRELIDQIRAQLDGELTAAERAAVAEHLAVCPPCVEYLQNYRQTIVLSQRSQLPESAEAEIPEPVARQILDNLRTKRQQAEG